MQEPADSGTFVCTDNAVHIPFVPSNGSAIRIGNHTLDSGAAQPIAIAPTGATALGAHVLGDMVQLFETPTNWSLHQFGPFGVLTGGVKDLHVAHGRIAITTELGVYTYETTPPYAMITSGIGAAFGCQRAAILSPTRIVTECEPSLITWYEFGDAAPPRPPAPPPPLPGNEVSTGWVETGPWTAELPMPTRVFGMHAPTGCVLTGTTIDGSEVVIVNHADAPVVTAVSVTCEDSSVLASTLTVFGESKPTVPISVPASGSFGVFFRAEGESTIELIDNVTVVEGPHPDLCSVAGGVLDVGPSSCDALLTGSDTAKVRAVACQARRGCGTNETEEVCHTYALSLDPSSVVTVAATGPSSGTWSAHLVHEPHQIHNQTLVEIVVAIAGSDLPPFDEPTSPDGKVTVLDSWGGIYHLLVNADITRGFSLEFGPITLDVLAKLLTGVPAASSSLFLATASGSQVSSTSHMINGTSSNRVNQITTVNETATKVIVPRFPNETACTHMYAPSANENLRLIGLESNAIAATVERSGCDEIAVCASQRGFVRVRYATESVCASSSSLLRSNATTERTVDVEVTDAATANGEDAELASGTSLVSSTSTKACDAAGEESLTEGQGTWTITGAGCFSTNATAGCSDQFCVTTSGVGRATFWIGTILVLGMGI